MKVILAKTVGLFQTDQFLWSLNLLLTNHGYSNCLKHLHDDCD